MSHIIDTLISEGLLDSKTYRSQSVVAATAAVTTTLDVTSESVLIYTGTTAGQIVKLGDATTYQVGHMYWIHNNSTQNVTLNDNASTTLATIKPGQRANAILQNIGTAAGIWALTVTQIITTAAAVTQNVDQANAAGTSTSLALADHIHNIPTATPSSIGSANAQGSATTTVKSDHVHRGIASLDVNAGTDRYGDVTLQQGTNLTIVDGGSGTFTFNATSQIGTGLKIKAGTVTAGTFAGSPKKATVTFGAAFSAATYAINITGGDGRTWTYESVAAGSFVINANANAALTQDVRWEAIFVGESN